MKKHVWIMNHYAGVMYFDKGWRHYNFAKYLKKAGYEPVIFCANSKHGSAETWFSSNLLWQENMVEAGIPFVFVRARTYTGNGRQRVLNILDFYRNVKKAGKEYAGKYGNPDIIYASSVHPLTLVAGIQLAKYFGVECVCEVRDLWPETLVATFPEKFPPQKLWVKSLYWGEKWIYTKADRLIFTFEGGYDYILNRGWDKAIPRSKAFYINNGVDLEAFYYNRDHCRVNDPDLEDPDSFKLVYAGSIRVSNGLYEMMECAELLRDYADIKFLVYGGGEDFETLKEIVQKKRLVNFILKGSVKKEEIPYVLSKASATLLNYTEAEQKTFQYGSSNNKLFEYLASGRPVISNVRIAYSPIDHEHCGILADTPSKEDYAKAVLQIYEMSPEAYAGMCHNAQKAAEKYDFKFLTEKLISVLERNEK